MSSSMPMENTIHSGSEAFALPTSRSLASWLRWFGSGLVLLGATSFLLQGYGAVTDELRNWSFVLLMLGCASAALLIERFFGDAKGARLLFGLAVLLVPVQFAQMASVIYDLSNVSVQAMTGTPFQPEAPGFAAASGPILLFVGTVVVGLFASFTGMRILGGNSGRHLALGLLALSSLLLVPVREGVAGIVSVAAVLIGYGLTLAWLDWRKPQLRTFEGRSALLLLLVPVLIAAVRFGLHDHTLATTCLLVALLSVALIESARRLFGNGRLSNLVALIGLTSFAMATVTQLLIVTRHWPQELGLAVSFAPAVIYWIESSRWIAFGSVLLRFGASLMLMLVAIGQLDSASFSGALCLLAIGTGYAGWGAAREYRQPLFVGILLALIATGQCLVLSLSNVEINSWLALAASGIIVVLLASASERHSARLLSLGRSSWARVRTWP